MTTDRERRLEEVLAQFIRPVRGIPFEVIIRSLCGVGVLAFDRAVDQNKALLRQMVAAMRTACATVRAKPIERPRPNEVGNDMEPFVIAALKAQGLDAAAPKTKGGLGKSTGYPDLKITRAGPPLFVEVKTFATGTSHGTMRSFYLSPADDPKVHEEGMHLLVGFEMERTGNFYAPVAFELVDLFGLECDMKSEFNSDNRRLYHLDRVLARERV